MKIGDSTFALDDIDTCLPRAVPAVIVALSLACAVPRPPSATLAQPKTQPAVQGILGLFQTHPIVLIGESHRSAETHAFLRALVTHPDFPNSVDDIVIESGNTLYQPLLDRYVRGDAVPRDSLRLVWRNTTQLLAWDSPLYEQFIETVREVNKSLPATKRLRVLAGDPPIDWSRVATAADFPKSYGYRDWQTTEIVEKEVLARGRRALIVIGSAHIYRREPRRDTVIPPREKLGLGEALELAHPDAAYAIYTIVGKQHPEVESRLGSSATPPALVPIRGDPLGKQSSSLLFGRVIRIGGDSARPQTPLPSIEDVIDAFLYLGPVDTKVLPERSLYRENPAYLQEIRRRIRILTQVYGGDFWTEELDQLLERR